jgi:hypothetical protein
MRANHPSRLAGAVLSFGVVLTCAAMAEASVDYATDGATYTENFNSLAPASAGATVTWTNNLTIPGFYMFYSGATSASPGDVDATGTWAPATFYRASASASVASTARAYAFGPDDDRTLGAMPGTSSSQNPGDFFFALVQRNTTGQTLSQVTVTYTGEQWIEARVLSGDSAQDPSTLVFSYKVASAFTASDVVTEGGFGDYSLNAALDFTTPITGNTNTTVNFLDGNADANREVLSTTLNVNWASGEYLILRWWMDDDSSFSHGFGLDDLSVTANVPTPASGLLLVVMGGLWMWRRTP